MNFLHLLLGLLAFNAILAALLVFTTPRRARARVCRPNRFRP